MTAPAPLRELGITVLPEYIQSDGIEGVLRNIRDIARATSVTTSPYVVTEAAPGTGEREPPIDGGAGKDRLLDRPLWGKRDVWMTASCSYTPDAARYAGLAYRPPATDAATARDGHLVGEFLTAAKARGMETWIQVQAAIPPGHRVQFGRPNPGDRSLLPDGTAFDARVDRNASLAAPDLRAYMRAFVADLCAAYPQADGFKFDWPEYPAYHFEALFFDFNPAAAPYAARAGLDFAALRRGVGELLAALGTPEIRRRTVALDNADSFRDSLFAAWPVLADLAAFKVEIVADYAGFLRDTVAESSRGRKRVFLQCFPPPLNIATGFDLARLGALCDMVGVKTYTMHWPLIERNILTALQARTDFPPAAIIRALTAILGFAADAERTPGDIRYPEPDDPHPAPAAGLTAKMRAARAALPASSRMCGITHGYGPTADVMRRFDAVAEGAGSAVHVNRYAYLSDAKLAAIGTRGEAG
ncbi:MAG: hypothetical protein O3B08_01780 [Proteobacteria bacterium]|nr:hypothetical protein [Pseudomonadota bacterium]